MNDVTMEVINHSFDNGNLLLNMEIKNNTSEAISILKPRPVKPGKYFMSSVPPDFFIVNFTNQEEECVISEPANSGTKLTKTKFDFLTIEANSSITFTIKCSDYSAYYCEEELLDVEIIYSFDTSLLDKEHFENTIRKKGQLNETQSNEMFQLISSTYQTPLTATTSIRK
jgi:hypothetical protein